MELEQVAQKMFRKKASGEKYIICLYFSHDMHPIFLKIMGVIIQVMQYQFEVLVENE